MQLSCCNNVVATLQFPCQLIMRELNTYVVSEAVEGGCCRFPDTVGVGVWAPDFFATQWAFNGTAVLRGVPAYVFTDANDFEWILRQDTMQPLRWVFGGSRARFDYTSALVPAKLNASVFALPPSPSCQLFCPFRWD